MGLVHVCSANPQSQLSQRPMFTELHVFFFCIFLSLLSQLDGVGGGSLDFIWLLLSFCSLLPLKINYSNQWMWLYFKYVISKWLQFRLMGVICAGETFTTVTLLWCGDPPSPNAHQVMHCLSIFPCLSSSDKKNKTKKRPCSVRPTSQTVLISKTTTDCDIIDLILRPVGGMWFSFPPHICILNI